MLLEKDKGIAASEFRDDVNLKELTKLLGELGYEWTLEDCQSTEKSIRHKTKEAGLFVSGGCRIVRRA